MDRVAPGKLLRFVGIGAGVLLLVLVALALTPPLFVRYRVHAFTGRLHVGMTAAQVRKAASEVHVFASVANSSEMVFPVDEPWTFGSNCSSDYVVAIALKNGRITKWSPVEERLCLKP